jgi:hypothetical protein
MARVRQKFTIEVESALLAELRKIAEHHGQPIEAVIDDDRRAVIEKRSRTKPRRRVMDAYRSSLQRYGAFYEKLAK